MFPSNQHLESAAIQDINSRYYNSFVLYNNALIWFQTINCVTSSQGKTEFILTYNKVSYSPRPVGEPEYCVWEWQKLNVNRPDAGWYVDQSNGPFYFYYLPKRQYCRGIKLSDHPNAAIYMPGILPNRLTHTLAMWSVFYPQPINQHRILVEELQRKLFHSNKAVILRNSIAFIPNCDNNYTTEIFFRTLKIGTTTQNGDFHLIANLFKQELKDCIPDLNLEKVHTHGT